jgi:hypothetical protein
MRLFISWSRPRSHELALLLKEQLPDIIQEIDPWVSSEDIDKGQRWARDVGEQLSKIHQGIICLTPENVDQPWLNFEAGALAKALDESRVRPVLLDIVPSAIKGPLDQFQATIASDHNDMRKLMQSLNDVCSQPLDVQRLDRQFYRTWPELSEGVAAISRMSSRSPGTPKRPTNDMVREILDRTRELQRTIEIGRQPIGISAMRGRPVTVQLSDGTFAQPGLTVIHARHGIGRIKQVWPLAADDGHGVVVVTFGFGGSLVTVPAKNLRAGDDLAVDSDKSTT